MAIHIDVIRDNETIDTYIGNRCSVSSHDDIISYIEFLGWYNAISKKYEMICEEIPNSSNELRKEYEEMIVFCEKYLDDKELSFRLS